METEGILDLSMGNDSDEGLEEGQRSPDEEDDEQVEDYAVDNKADCGGGAQDRDSDDDSDWNSDRGSDRSDRDSDRDVDDEADRSDKALGSEIVEPAIVNRRDDSVDTLPEVLVQGSLESWVISIRERVNVKPERLTTLSINESCSIHRVPRCFRQHNKKAYDPHIISIGPFHHKKRESKLKSMDEHKRRYLHEILEDHKERDLLSRCLLAIGKLEKKVRDCYTEKVDLGGKEFVEMLVLDGFFIIEFFCRSKNNPDDPIHRLGWVKRAIRTDLLLLENQIPFFVLESLCEVMGLQFNDFLTKHVRPFFFNEKAPNSTQKEERENAPAVYAPNVSSAPASAVDAPNVSSAPAVDDPNDSSTPAVSTPNVSSAPAVDAPNDSSAPLVSTLNVSSAPTVDASNDSSAPAVDAPNVSSAPAVSSPSDSSAPAVDMDPPNVSSAPAVDTPNDSSAPPPGVSIPNDSSAPSPAVPIPNYDSSSAPPPAVSVPNDRSSPPPPVSPTVTSCPPPTVFIPNDSSAQRENATKFQHLLHFVHFFHAPKPGCYIPPSPKLPIIPNASRLQEAGIKFDKEPSSSDIKFEKGVIKIPLLKVKDANKSVLLNLVAFEQCYRHCYSHFSGYTYFMDCLIDNAKDVQILYENGIINRWLSSDQEVAAFFNKMGRDIVVYDHDSNLLNVCEEIERYYGNSWNAWRTSLKRTYFKNPWAIISVAAASVLLLLTFLKTFFSAFPKFAYGK